MPRVVTLPPIGLSPEELAKVVFKKHVEDNNNLCNSANELEGRDDVKDTTPPKS